MITQKKIFTVEECRYILNQIYTQPLKSPHTTSLQESYRFKGANIKYLNVNIYNPDYSKILTLLEDRLREFGVVKIPPTIDLLEYTVGSSQKEHRDDYRSVKRGRSISIMLSEEEDYEGGNLIIEDSIASKEIGTLIFFPSDKLHSVSKVTSGKRLVLVMFLRQENLHIKSGLI